MASGVNTTCLEWVTGFFGVIWVESAGDFVGGVLMSAWVFGWLDGVLR